MYRSALILVSFLAGCSGTSESTGSAPQRPGVKDSSKAFMGTPSPADDAFWVAVRNGDDAARQAAVANLKTDLTKDPTDGYSAFLAAASTFMPTSTFLRALAANQPLPPPHGPFPEDTAPLLQQAIANVTDPLYLGFSATLLAGLQASRGDPAAAQTTQVAVSNNFPASTALGIGAALQMGNLPGVLDIMYGLFEYCNGGVKIDRANPDVDAFVDKANAAGFVHRECYSGYHAMHGTEGLLLMIGDISALTGSGQVAARYYNGMRRATNYATWPLQPLAERRISGAQPAIPGDLNSVRSCTTCHVNQLQ
jgi:hypothetical protein